MSVAPTCFSVAICTRNRHRLLERSIASVFAQEYPPALFELIVIDNDSTDGTASVIDRCLASTPIRVSRHLERRRGISTSRNKAAELAHFEYIAFLDDDAAAAPGWLAAYDAAVRLHGATVVGGRVEPVIERGIEAPRWWSDGDIRGLFGLDHARSVGGQSVARIRWPLWLGGGNCVYAKAVLQAAGGFRTDLGPTGRRRRMAEDIELNLRLERAAVPVYYAHDAVIHHLVTADRLSRRSMWQRAYWAGRTDAAAQAFVTGRVKQMPPSRLLRTAMAVMRAPARTVPLCRFAYDAGYALQSRTATFGKGVT
jgi:glycosyltransferase involved in cell wall biosynthesis